MPSLAALCVDDRFSVDLVISQPDKPVGRSQELTPSPVKIFAKEQGIEVWQPENLNKEFAAYHFAKRPDFLVVVAYGQILSQQILDFPIIAPVNVHASLLPTLRGASPLQHAVLLGHKQSGVTIQKMVRELDAGPILGQSSIDLDPRETTASLHDKLSALGASLLIETLSQPLKPIDQDDSKATFCRKLTRDDGIVDFRTMTAQEIDRKVRALVPWPGVKWNDIKILATDVVAQPNSIAVSCAHNTQLFITSLQPSGRKPMSGTDFDRGYAEVVKKMKNLSL